jgi:regulator of replication initiation timing
MWWKLLLVGIGFVFIGTSAGYLIADQRYQPVINDLNTRVSDLSGDVVELTEETGRLSQTNRDLGQINSTLEIEKTTLKSNLNTAEQKITGYKAEVSGLESRISVLDSQVSDLKTQEAGLQSRIDRILDTTVIQHYDWLNTWTWELSIPLSLYIEYKERPRPRGVSNFVSLAKDPGDDQYIDQMIKFIEEKARQYGFGEQQKINFVITFVQSLPYTVDSVTALADEYPRYPVETLFDRGGDCEDTSILVSAILDRMGYDVALINPPKHMAVGIVSAAATGRYFEYNGKKYFYLETTGEGWRIGEIPREYIGVSANIYPLR